jgi:hypothetical protein
LLQLRHESDARIFNAPDLFRILSGIRYQCGFAIDEPSINPVLRARGAKMRQTTAILDAAKQECRAVSE